MNRAKELILHRIPKFAAGNLLGTLVDTLCVSGTYNFMMNELVIFKKKNK